MGVSTAHDARPPSSQGWTKKKEEEKEEDAPSDDRWSATRVVAHDDGALGGAWRALSPRHSPPRARQTVTKRRRRRQRHKNTTTRKKRRRWRRRKGDGMARRESRAVQKTVERCEKRSECVERYSKDGWSTRRRRRRRRGGPLPLLSFPHPPGEAPAHAKTTTWRRWWSNEKASCRRVLLVWMCGGVFPVVVEEGMEGSVEATMGVPQGIVETAEVLPFSFRFPPPPSRDEEEEGKKERERSWRTPTGPSARPTTSFVSHVAPWMGWAAHGRGEKGNISSHRSEGVPQKTTMRTAPSVMVLTALDTRKTTTRRRRQTA